MWQPGCSECFLLPAVCWGFSMVQALWVDTWLQAAPGQGEEALFPCCAPQAPAPHCQGPGETLLLSQQECQKPVDSDSLHQEKVYLHPKV